MSILKLFLISILILPMLATQCSICDSFLGYCDFDGDKCVGPRCSRRTAPTASGLIREQRLCVPSDSPIGCRKAILWDDIEGTECVCEGDMCNNSTRRSWWMAVFTILAFLDILFQH